MSAISVSLYGRLYHWGQAKCPLCGIARCLYFRGSACMYCKSMEMAFRTKQSVRIIVHVDVRISGVSARWGPTVLVPWARPLHSAGFSSFRINGRRVTAHAHLDPCCVTFRNMTQKSVMLFILILHSKMPAKATHRVFFFDGRNTKTVRQLHKLLAMR